MNYPSLTDILTQQAPEQKPEINGVLHSDFTPPFESFDTITPPPSPSVSTPPPNSSDFDTPPPPVTEPEPVAEKPRLSESEYRMNAELTVALVDGLQTLTIPYLYQKNLYTKEEKELLPTLRDKAKIKSGEVSYSEEETALLAKYMAIEELKKEVPFSDQEKELLITPLAQIYSKYNIQVGPEYTLLAALAMIMTPRILPLFNGIEKEF